MRYATPCTIKMWDSYQYQLIGTYYNRVFDLESCTCTYVLSFTQTIFEKYWKPAALANFSHSSNFWTFVCTM